MRSDCPISYGLDFFGDKWTLLIIRDLAFEGKSFYNDFLHSKEGIATNILSDRLKKLELNGIIASRVYEKLRTKKEYFLTDKGKELIPVLLEMIIWSTTQQDGLAVPADFLEGAKNDREELIKRVLASLD